MPNGSGWTKGGEKRFGRGLIGDRLRLASHFAGIHQRLSQIDAFFGVHLQQSHSSNARHSQSVNLCAPKLKVLFPTIVTWMKQGHDPLRGQVNRRDIWTFEAIAIRAGVSEVIVGVIDDVLLCDDVFNVKGVQRHGGAR